MAEIKQVRRLVSYPTPIYARLVRGYAADKGKTESRAILEMVQRFFENVPDHDKKIYLSKSEK